MLNGCVWSEEVSVPHAEHSGTQADALMDFLPSVAAWSGVQTFSLTAAGGKGPNTPGTFTHMSLARACHGTLTKELGSGQSKVIFSEHSHLCRSSRKPPWLFLSANLAGTNFKIYPESNIFLCAHCYYSTLSHHHLSPGWLKGSPSWSLSFRLYSFFLLIQFSHSSQCDPSDTWAISYYFSMRASCHIWNKI